MDIFKKLFTNNVEKGIKLPSLGSSIMNGVRFSLPSQKNDVEYLKEYKNWVFACVNARAEEVASIELVLRNKNTDEEVVSSDILTLLNDVNPDSTKYELFFATQAMLDMTGNAYWYLARDNEGTGKIRQIYFISPEKMTILLDKDNQLNIKGYVYGAKGNEVVFEANEIIHFKNFNPNGGYPRPHTGVGVVQSALWAIETDNEARNWNYSFFKNSARPDGVLSTEQILGDSEFKRLKEQWEQTHRGSGNVGKTALLESGLKWQDISKTQKDMDFIAQRTFSRDEILSIFRVPKTVVGITDDVNRANAEASDYVFAKRTIKPLMQRFITVLNEYLLPEYDKNLIFTFKDPVPQDRLVQLQQYSLGVNKWLTRNDIRRAEGLTESDNGDTFYGTFSEVPQDSVKPLPQAPKSLKKGIVDKTIDDFVAKLPKKEMKIRKLSASQKSMFKEIWIKRFDENEKKLVTELIKYFKTQEAEVLKNAEEEFAGLKPKEFKIKGIDDVLFDEKKAVSAGISLMTPFIRQFLQEGADIADSVTGGEFNLNDVSALKFIQERAKFFAESINDTTREALLTQIQDAVNDGKGTEDIKNIIANIYQGAEDYRVNMITRTEVSASLNEGVIEAYKQAGVEDVEWVAILDDVTSDECLGNDGEIQKLGANFSGGVSQPPQHVNCRCTTNPIFKD